MRSNATLLLAVLTGALALGAGCAHQYSYVPVGPGSAGGPAARFPVPPAAPQGEVYVTSFGFTDFDNGQGGAQRLLHTRVAVANAAARSHVGASRRATAVPRGAGPAAAGAVVRQHERGRAGTRVSGGTGRDERVRLLLRAAARLRAARVARRVRARLERERRWRRRREPDGLRALGRAAVLLRALSAVRRGRARVRRRLVVRAVLSLSALPAGHPRLLLLAGAHVGRTVSRAATRGVARGAPTRRLARGAPPLRLRAAGWHGTPSTFALGARPRRGRLAAAVAAGVTDPARFAKGGFRPSRGLSSCFVRLGGAAKPRLHCAVGTRAQRRPLAPPAPRVTAQAR